MVVFAMLRSAVIAVVGALALAGGVAACLGSPFRARAEASLRGAQGSDPSGETAIVAKAADGHFWAQGMVNGVPIRFLVDTGASVVSLTPQDAQRLGVEIGGLTYDLPVRLAGGDGLAARVRLDSVSVGGVQEPGVEALVVGRGLPASLLGMSYLGRLSRFEATPDALVLRP